jgi:hypothetical protein
VGIELVRNKMYKLLNGNPMEEIFPVVGDTCSDQIVSLLQHIVQVLSNWDNYYSWGSVSTGKKGYRTVDTVVNGNETELDLSHIKLTTEKVGEIIKTIQSTTVVTSQENVNMSTDYYCNESSSFEVKVICRFGFLKL